MSADATRSLRLHGNSMVGHIRNIKDWEEPLDCHADGPGPDFVQVCAHFSRLEGVESMWFFCPHTIRYSLRVGHSFHRGGQGWI
jgi:hypothetical protein